MKRYHLVVFVGVVFVYWGITVLRKMIYTPGAWWGAGLATLGFAIVILVAFCGAEAARRGWRG